VQGARFHQWATCPRAHNFAPNWILGRRGVLADDEVAEKTQKQLLQAAADVADAMHGESKALRQAVQEHKQANPLDPRLEAWAEKMPKEPEEQRNPVRANGQL